MNTKSIKLMGMAAIVAFTMSCKDAQNEVEATAAAAEAEATMEAVTYKVDTAASSIAWVGSKPTADHTGTLALSSGMVMVNGEALESGEFTIDMNSMEVTDLEGEKAMKLKNHLSGIVEGTETDFFNVNKYPTAKFVVTGLNGKMLSGNLTMKDVTKNVSFPVTVSYDGDKMMLNSEEFTINRTDWGIKYGSQAFSDKVLDSAIADDIKLTVSLVATK
ncbi:MAG: YceI family protein [Nonlabens sp.]|uniref:YceI family protein n=1 Tax=Nonlabens sp. TaxID=1888209 RepID=UPI003EF27F7E